MKPIFPHRSNALSGAFILFTILIFSAAIACFAQNPGAISDEARVIQFPQPDTEGAVTLERAIAQRRSVRRFQDRALSMEQIGQIAWAAQGITEPSRGFRGAPSAGARFPLEIFLVNADGMGRYIPQGHRMEQIGTDDLRAALSDAALGQHSVASAALNVVIAAQYGRITGRYGERGRFYTHLEAGHVAQNVLLQVVALDLAAVPIGAFDPDRVKSLLGLPDDLDVLYILSIGHAE